MEAFDKSFILICLKTNFQFKVINNIFEIWVLKTYLFTILKINHQNCSLSWPHIWKVSLWDLNAENLVHLTWNGPYIICSDILMEENYETNFVFVQTEQMWRWLCSFGPTFCCTRIHCLLRDVAKERITSFSDKDNASNNNFLKNEIQFSRWKLKRQTTVLHIRCVTRL
jgi:hypothetical protein